MHEPDDYVSIYTPRAELDAEPHLPRRRRPDVRDRPPRYGLGKLLPSRAGSRRRDYRFDRIAEHVMPNTLRLLAWAREHGMRRVFLTYGSEVSDYSDLSPQMYELCRATRNGVGNREHELLDELTPRRRARHQQDHAERVHLEPARADPADLRLRHGALHRRLDEHVRRGDAARRLRPRLRLRARRGRTAAPTREDYHDGSCVVIQRLYGHVLGTAGGHRPPRVPARRRRGGRPCRLRRPPGGDAAMVRVGIDVGGTFTDLMLVDGASVTVHKVPSTPSDPSLATMAGLRELCALAGRELAATSRSCCTARRSRPTSCSSTTARAPGMITTERLPRPRSTSGATGGRRRSRSTRTCRGASPRWSSGGAPAGARARSCRRARSQTPLDEDEVARRDRAAARGGRRVGRRLLPVLVPQPAPRARGQGDPRRGDAGRARLDLVTRSPRNTASTSASRRRR